MKEVVDYTLETLLDLDGNIIEIGNGYWVKFQAKVVVKTTNKPVGVKYSLTLHDSQGERIMGYDNAHSVPGSSTKIPHDHIHKGSRIRQYDYKDAFKLLEDFWHDVDKLIARRN